MIAWVVIVILLHVHGMLMALCGQVHPGVCASKPIVYMCSQWIQAWHKCAGPVQCVAYTTSGVSMVIEPGASKLWCICKNSVTKLPHTNPLCTRRALYIWCGSMHCFSITMPACINHLCLPAKPLTRYRFLLIKIHQRLSTLATTVHILEPTIMNALSLNVILLHPIQAISNQYWAYHPVTTQCYHIIYTNKKYTAVMQVCGIVC